MGVLVLICDFLCGFRPTCLRGEAQSALATAAFVSRALPTMTPRTDREGRAEHRGGGLSHGSPLPSQQAGEQGHP